MINCNHIIFPKLTFNSEREQNEFISTEKAEFKLIFSVSSFVHLVSGHNMTTIISCN